MSQIKRPLDRDLNGRFRVKLTAGQGRTATFDEYLINPATSLRHIMGLSMGNDLKKRSVVRYGRVAQLFHWVTAILVVAAFIYGPGGSEQRVYSSARDFDRRLHETLGMCVFALVVLRVLWRMIDVHPEPPQVPRWMGAAAKTTHYVLYVLLFALPLTAINGAWLEGHPLTLLAGVEIPPLLALSHEAGATIATVHTWLGDAVLWVAGVHALAALYHHFVLKDRVLASMLPRWFPLWRSRSSG